MADSAKKHIVVSGVNLRKGGSLAIMRECLSYLSSCGEYKVTALVHSSKLFDFKGVEYIEVEWSAKSWLHRIWCEYVFMNRLSKKMAPADLWLSLHDTTPRVKAARQAVYCHNSFPFLKVMKRDWTMDFKIPLFAHLTHVLYRFRVHRNRFLVVQQEWMREGLGRMCRFPKDRIIVAPPELDIPPIESRAAAVPTFIYPCTPDCHKNVETLLEAAGFLEKKGERFRVMLTINGKENKYAEWLQREFSSLTSVEFAGFLKKEDLFHAYGRSACLVFPSRVETWGLPISEFKTTGRPMLLADLPYAHESASGAPLVRYFVDAEDLAMGMECVIHDNLQTFHSVPAMDYPAPFAGNWSTLFNLLLA